MADDKNTPKDTQHAPSTPEKTQNEQTNTGTPDPNTFATADTSVADAAGISEGDVKALRDDAGVNQLAGNEANTLAWETTEAGKQYVKDEKDREKKYKDEAKKYDEQTNKDGLTEAEAKYKEAVDKARKG